MIEADIPKIEKRLKKIKSKLIIEGLDDAYDLAQIIKYLMIDRKKTYNVYGNRKTLQCDAGCSRTIQDLYRACLNYLPNVSLNQVYKAVIQLYGKNIYGENNYRLDNNERKKLGFVTCASQLPTQILSSSYCTTVRKIVHQPSKLTIKSKDIRVCLKSLNIKNLNYTKKL